MADVSRSINGARGALFERTVKAARIVVTRRLRVLNVVRAAYRHLASHESGARRMGEDFHRLIRLARAWAKREYTVIPWRSLVYVVAALLYFINPIDVIPDALVGLGFVDDAAVVAAVVRALRREIAAFDAWESTDEASILPAPVREAA